jgi:Polysaccharide deacetylase
MRVASACAILVAIVLAAYATWAQTRAPVSATSPASAPAATTAPTPAAAPPSAATAAPAPVAAPAPTLAAGSPPAAASAPACAGIPNALGLARVVEIDTASGPGFGWEHFKMHDFLRNGEVVLTFDDGPWPGTTPAVLKALADHCIRATFFPIGKHATYHPDILKQVAAAGHSIGNHTWGHKDLSKKPYDNLDLAKEEIERESAPCAWYWGSPARRSSASPP